MSTHYAVVLRACEAACVNAVGSLLGRAFSLKDSTCANILQSAPIILIDNLNLDETAALSLCLRTLTAAGADIHYIAQDSEDLPKIDWPKQPSIFKQNIPTLIRAYDMPLLIDGSAYSLLALLKEKISLNHDEDDAYAPVEAPIKASQQVLPGSTSKLTSIKEFTGAHLPEVTPFSNMALSEPIKPPTPAGGTAVSSDDLGLRMNELFGNDEDELIPSSNEVTNILDKLLPDDEPSSAQIHAVGPQRGIGIAANGSESSGANQILPSGSGTFSLFLSKIPDAARRNKAVPIIAELADIAKEDAEALVKKVIIPVLRSVSQDEAEAAKHRFAEIGVLARIKNS